MSSRVCDFPIGLLHLVGHVGPEGRETFGELFIGEGKYLGGKDGRIFCPGLTYPYRRHGYTGGHLNGGKEGIHAQETGRRDGNADDRYGRIGGDKTGQVRFKYFSQSTVDRPDAASLLRFIERML